MTVYELIQELAQYNSDAEITLQIIGERKRIESYLEDQEDLEYIGLDGDIETIKLQRQRWIEIICTVDAL